MRTVHPAHPPCSITPCKLPAQTVHPYPSDMSHLLWPSCLSLWSQGSAFLCFWGGPAATGPAPTMSEYRHDEEGYGCLEASPWWWLPSRLCFSVECICPGAECLSEAVFEIFMVTERRIWTSKSCVVLHSYFGCHEPQRFGAELLSRYREIN